MTRQQQQQHVNKGGTQPQYTAEAHVDKKEHKLHTFGPLSASKNTSKAMENATWGIIVSNAA